MKGCVGVHPFSIPPFIAINRSSPTALSSLLSSYYSSSPSISTAIFFRRYSPGIIFSKPQRVLSPTATRKRGRVRSLFVEEAEKSKPPENKKGTMTITPAVRIAERKLLVKDHTILSNVPDNVISTSAATSGPVQGLFLGAEFPRDDSRHVIPLGVLRDVRFLACFRFKLWWMAQKMGDLGRDVPLETQFLLLETKDGSPPESQAAGENPTVYTVFLPLTEGPFRACIQGNPQDELELCLESGDAATRASSFTHTLFISAAADPFSAISEAIGAVKSHLKTFRQLREKHLPGIVDYFGWCTWDAFYQDVTQEGVEAGLASLAAGGTPPKFVIIDDGWQSVGSDPDHEQRQQLGEQKPLQRLTNIKENSKFQDKDDSSIGIKSIAKIAKEKYGLKFVYVWHAITGYWGGVRPGVEGMEEYGSTMKYPQISNGVESNEPWWKTDALKVQGLGLVNPKNVYRFYNELHGYLASAGVDGVKVDAQCILETLGEGFGGRVELTRQYHQALDASIARNFLDNACIACMSHNTDALYCSKQTAVVRASDDFFPRDPVSHTIHIAAVAYNSLFLGEIMQPDWDMFHSRHPAGEYHASARAISGGPVYVSDKPGEHNFELLKKLVLPDGSVLRALLPGRPTQDCLFADPSRDGVSLLKIWNMNKYTGVLGVYNCQGAAWSTVEKKNVFHHTQAEVLTGSVRGRDIHLLSHAAIDSQWNGDCIVYSHNGGDLVRLPSNASLPVSLKVLQHEIFTISPIKVLASGFSFAPVGLVDMFNAGGAIQGLKYEVGDGAAFVELDSGFSGEASGISQQSLENKSSKAVGMVFMEVKGCGRFGAYSSVKPRKCLVGQDCVEFSYGSSSGLLVLNLGHMPVGDKSLHSVVIEV